MELKRVVITGIGALTPIGNSASDYFDSLKKGVSGSAPITRFDASKFKTQFACEVKNFNVEDHLHRKEARKMDIFSQYAVVTAEEAVLDSGMNLDVCARYAKIYVVQKIKTPPEIKINTRV